MLTLGLDPSLTAFGWCVHDSNAEGPARVVARGRFKTSARDIFVQRYMHLREWVGELVDKYEVRAVGVESVVFGEQYSEGLYGLFLYVNEAIFVRRKDVVFFDPGTLKMLTKLDPELRPGKMHKSDMVQAARDDTGIKSKFNHNEADAYHAARFAARFWEYIDGVISDEDLVPSEKKAFVASHTFVKGARAGETIKTGAVFKENQRFFQFSKLPK